MGVFDRPPVVVAHRGGGRRPGPVDPAGPVENTVGAIEAAVAAGARWVEIDVRRTRDDALVVLHNPRHAGGRFVAELTAREAAAAGLPALGDVLGALPPGVGLDVDVKTALEDADRPADATTAALLAPLLLAEAARRPLLATSFDPAALLHLRGAAPGVALGLLTWLTFPLRKAIPAAAHLGVEVVAAHTGSFLPDPRDPAPQHHDPAYAIEVAHRAGLEVAAWCPGPADAVRLAAAGVDALVADDVTAVTGALDAARRGAH